MTSMDLQEDDFRPSAARLVESLRDTGYSEKAAFADIVDNSIAANATKISIELQYLMGEFRVIITDNGEGMTDAELKNAMRYGSDKRPNPKSLGKFGMGLKTASTAFCRRLVVLSRKEGYNVGRSWDLDTICKKDKWELETPDHDDYYEDFESLEAFAGDAGTMIIWEKIDRLVKQGSDKQVVKQINGHAKVDFPTKIGISICPTGIGSGKVRTDDFFLPTSGRINLFGIAHGPIKSQIIGSRMLAAQNKPPLVRTSITVSCATATFVKITDNIGTKSIGTGTGHHASISSPTAIT